MYINLYHVIGIPNIMSKLDFIEFIQPKPFKKSLRIIYICLFIWKIYLWFRFTEHLHVSSNSTEKYGVDVILKTVRAHWSKRQAETGSSQRHYFSQEEIASGVTPNLLSILQLIMQVICLLYFFTELGKVLSITVLNTLVYMILVKPQINILYLRCKFPSFKLFYNLINILE